MEKWLSDKLKQVENRTNILNTAGESDIFRKIAQVHQSDDHTRINQHGEAYCFMCFKKDRALATVVQICRNCLTKKERVGRKNMESLLNKLKEEIYGYCFNCGTYQMNISHLNIRVCLSCNRRIAEKIQEWHKAGGVEGADPFYQYLRVKLGKDWKALSNPYIRLKR